MTSPYHNLPLNPFEKDMVQELKECRVSVDSLNREALDALMREAGMLYRGKAPRGERRAPHAKLVLSPAPGYGKTHLIGRLFHELAGRALVIDLNPFQTVALCWQSILDHVVKKLNDRFDVTHDDEENAFGWDKPKQLDAFAHGVLRNLVASAIEHQAYPIEGNTDPKAMAEFLRDHTGMNLRDDNDEWGNFIRDNWERKDGIALLPVCRAELARHNIHLRREGWLKVLFHYATSQNYSEKRDICLAWLRGYNIDPEAGAQIGLTAVDRPNVELAEAINELCRSRIFDICQLASFYRPFVFCFDQTEDYAGSDDLVVEFGRVLVTLVNEFPNQLTIVTANQTIWDQKILQRLDTAHHARVDHPIVLTGLRRQEAKQLVNLRLEPWKVPGDVRDRFLSDAWLDELFPGNSRVPVREFMQLCRQRWQNDDSSKKEEKRPIDKIYAEYVAEHEVAPERLEYDGDILRWLVREPLARRAGLNNEGFIEPHGYVERHWEVPGEASILFGFRREMQWNSWLALCKLAADWKEKHGVPVAKIVVFRTPELLEVPNPTWSSAGEINRARKDCVDFVQLEDADIARLYAARHLYADAEQGDVVGYTGQAVLDFLEEELAGWRERLLGPIPEPAKKQSAPVMAPPSGIRSANGVHANGHAPGNGARVEQVRRLLQNERYLSLTDALEKLGDGWERQELLNIAAKIPQVQRVSHPNVMLLLWQDS